MLKSTSPETVSQLAHRRLEFSCYKDKRGCVPNLRLRSSTGNTGHALETPHSGTLPQPHFAPRRLPHVALAVLSDAEERVLRRRRAAHACDARADLLCLHREREVPARRRSCRRTSPSSLWSRSCSTARARCASSASDTQTTPRSAFFVVQRVFGNKKNRYLSFNNLLHVSFHLTATNSMPFDDGANAKCPAAHYHRGL